MSCLNNLSCFGCCGMLSVTAVFTVYVGMQECHGDKCSCGCMLLVTAAEHASRPAKPLQYLSETVQSELSWTVPAELLE